MLDIYAVTWYTVRVGTRRDGREAEGAPLLREYAGQTASWVQIPLSPSYAPVAQLDRVHGYEPWGRGFESLLAHLSCISF